MFELRFVLPPAPCSKDEETQILNAFGDYWRQQSGGLWPSTASKYITETNKAINKNNLKKKT